MKKTIGFTVMVMLLGWANATDAQIRIGVIGGLNDSNFFIEQDNPFGAEPNDFHNRTVYGFGGVLEVPLIPHLSFRSQLMFLKKASFYNQGEHLNFLYTVDYLELPVCIKASIGEKIQPYLLAGASFGYVMRAEAEMNQFGIEGIADLTKIAEKVDTSILLGGGIGYRLRMATFFVEGVYEHGLRNINKGGTAEVTLDQTVVTALDVDPLEIKTRGFQVMTGVLFSLW